MLEICDGYNKIKFEINDYISKKARKINNMDEDDCWCDLYLSIENEYIKIENSYYDLECREVDNLYEDLELFINDKMQNNRSFEPIEEAFKIYFFPYGEEYQNDNYVQENLSRDNRTAKLFMAFIEKDTKAPSSDGVLVELFINDVKRILEYLEKIIKDSIKR